VKSTEAAPVNNDDDNDDSYIIDYNRPTTASQLPSEHCAFFV